MRLYLATATTCEANVSGLTTESDGFSRCWRNDFYIDDYVIVSSLFDTCNW